MKLWIFPAALAAVALLASTCAFSSSAQNTAQGPAPTPPMGWNSWDAYGLTITEPQFRANVDVLRQKLLPFGWNYAVIDEGWFFTNPEDRSRPDSLHYAVDHYGRYVPVPARFPSALVAGTPPPVLSPASGNDKLSATIEDTSFAALGAWVHSQGLKFGIHIVRGIPRVSVERNLPIEGANGEASHFHAQDAADTTDACPWDPTNWGVKDNAAGQAWYDSLLRQYASWGVDLLKVDCIASHPYKIDEIRMIRRAIDKTGRPIVLSLSPGPTALAHAAEIEKLGNMWRISNDEWDVWYSGGEEFPQGVKDQFARLAEWEPYTGPNHWPDADMLPLGQLRPHPGWGEPRASRLTPADEQTQVTLWAIARSPLIVGANLTLLDAPTLRLLTNRDVIAIDQTSTRSRQIAHDGSLIAWQAELPGGRMALAIFNTGDTPLKVDRAFVSLLSAGQGNAAAGGKEWRVRNVWAEKDLGRQSRVSTDLAPHACILLLLR